MSDFPTVLISKTIYTGIRLIDSFSIIITYTGSIDMEITSNATDPTPVWTNLGSIINNTSNTGTFINPGRFIQYRIIGSPGSIITGIQLTLHSTNNDTRINGTGNIIVNADSTVAYLQDIRILTEVGL